MSAKKFRASLRLLAILVLTVVATTIIVEIIRYATK
jgi:hypothetical protein